MIIKKDEEEQNKYGCFLHNDIVGKEWGYKVCIISIIISIHYLYKNTFYSQSMRCPQRLEKDLFIY